MRVLSFFQCHAGKPTYGSLAWRSAAQSGNLQDWIGETEIKRKTLVLCGGMVIV
jgi:hypothetical protein